MNREKKNANKLCALYFLVEAALFATITIIYLDE